MSFLKGQFDVGLVLPVLIGLLYAGTGGWTAERWNTALAVMGQVIRGYGVPYLYEGNASLMNCYDWLKRGELLITHGWFTGSGHVICLDGLRQNANGSHSLNVKDPWSEFNAPVWLYNLGTKFYDGFYSDRCIYAACVAGTGVTDAKRVYQAGRVDTGRKGMWVHRFLAP